MLFCSVHRSSSKRKLRMVQKILKVCLSETQASGKERMCKISFIPSNVNSRCKGSSGQGMKGCHKKAHKTTKRKIHFAALMDIRHIQKYEYISGMFERAISSVEILLCFIFFTYVVFFFLEVFRTNDRFQVRDQGQKELYTSISKR